MRNRIVKILAASTLAAVAILPAVGQANDLDPIPHASVTDVGCALAVGAGSTCSATFEADQPGSVAAIETHGNFHQLAPVTGGSVNIAWVDGGGETVFTADCTITGLYADALGTGPLDATDLLCTSNSVKDTYIAGTQTLLVTATAGDAALETEFHGRLVINGVGDLL